MPSSPQKASDALHGYRPDRRTFQCFRCAAAFPESASVPHRCATARLRHQAGVRVRPAAPPRSLRPTRRPASPTFPETFRVPRSRQPHHPGRRLLRFRPDGPRRRPGARAHPRATPRPGRAVRVPTALTPADPLCLLPHTGSRPGGPLTQLGTDRCGPQVAGVQRLDRSSPTGLRAALIRCGALPVSNNCRPGPLVPEEPASVSRDVSPACRRKRGDRAHAGVAHQQGHHLSPGRPG